MKYYLKVTCYEHVLGSAPNDFKRSARTSEFDSYEEAAWALINATTHNCPSFNIKFHFELTSDLDFKSV